MRMISIAFCLTALSATIQAQEFQNIFKGENVREIEKNAEKYFAVSGSTAPQKEEEEGENEFDHYMRWKWNMDYRVGADDRIMNFDLLNFLAYEKIKKTQNGNRATHGNWVDLGPTDYTVSDSYSGGGLGRITCIAFHPSNANTFWVGTALGGLWKTNDGGGTWTPWTDAFASIAISGIAVDYSNPDILYVLTGDGDASSSGYFGHSIGVLKSTNGGFTWQPTSLSWNTNEFVAGYKLIMHPSNAQILYAATTSGIYKTINGGDSWSQVYTIRTTDIEFCPSDDNIMYATTMNNIDSSWWQARFIKSLNGGNTWFDEWDPTFPDTSIRSAIAVSPSSPANVYILFGGTTAPGTFRGVYKSTNYGGAFLQKSTTPNILAGDSQGGGTYHQADYDLTIVVDPQDDHTIYVGGINLWKSVDNGVLWDRQTWWRRDDPQPYVHGDFHALEFKGNVLFAGVDGGIYSSPDGGGSWNESSSGLSIMQFYEIDIHNGVYVGGAQDNGTNEAALTNPQTHNIVGGDGFGCTWHSGNDQIQYLSTQDDIVRRQFGSNLYIWELGDAFWFTDIKMHTTNTNYLFITSKKELIRANEILPPVYVWDSLKTTTLLNVPGSTRILGYAQGISNADIMYVVNNKRIIKTNNLSAGDPVWDTIPNPVYGTAGISDVIVDPGNADRVWMTCGGYSTGNKVFFTPNGGDTWTNISGSLPNVPVRCITLHSGLNDNIYVGTDIGVFYKDSTLSDWIYFSNYLPNTIVSDLVISGGKVYAGTFGRGIWSADEYSLCPTNLVLTPVNDGNPYSTGMQIHHASNSISSTRILNGGLGTDVLYGAGNRVDLLPGFWAKTANIMVAKIEGCPD